MRSNDSVLAAEQRKKVAHGVSRGVVWNVTKPRQGRKTSSVSSAAPAGACCSGVSPTAHAVGYLLSHLRC